MPTPRGGRVCVSYTCGPWHRRDSVFVAAWLVVVQLVGGWLCWLEIVGCGLLQYVSGCA